MVSLLAQSAVDRGFEPRSGQTQIGICSFSVKHAELMRKSKDWLAPSGVTCLATDCCFSELDKNPAKRVGLVQSRHHHHLIEN